MKRTFIYNRDNKSKSKIIKNKSHYKILNQTPLKVNNYIIYNESKSNFKNKKNITSITSQNKLISLKINDLFDSFKLKNNKKNFCLSPRKNIELNSKQNIFRKCKINEAVPLTRKKSIVKK